MFDRIDQVVELLLKAKKDKKTTILAIGGLLAFGISVGAVAVYEKILRELEADSREEDC